MSEQVKTILFILILGVFTSVILLGMDLITEERIIENEEALKEAAILDGFEISYSPSSINETFTEHVTIEEINEYTFYTDTDTGRISFYFEGSGLWGPITGILTLESDFETIAHISVLAQEETPGLGGVVGSREYLDMFVEKEMEISIVKTTQPLTNSQVDSITGATRTSDLFEIVLNENYREYLAVWQANQE
ncbi:FMN-binding protein [Candidatus Xianfuyuplasma coldseepsis]|uniref:FMN-binding protein n=1 Tax=Candidatus Xianfuyuplasma coldseepsis TaxID=2782163 RepID=A0A7L7KSS3_9MOLU|nr:FMN-binding protein [Xianfuyuplasma coldseepsis]QMS85459.1 FMN-binding protein [Xianfuyuplasma coldseepsis]